MIWALLALVGVPLWLCALGILALVYRNRGLRKRHGDITVRVQRTCPGQTPQTHRRAGPDAPEPADTRQRAEDAAGRQGPVVIQKAGTYPLDDFTCYPGAGFGPACRYGDYSMTQVYNGRVYLATQYVHALTDVAGGAATNWATRIWSAPVP
jgi:hypothetical protein